MNTKPRHLGPSESVPHSRFVLAGEPLVFHCNFYNYWLQRTLLLDPSPGMDQVIQDAATAAAPCWPHPAHPIKEVCAPKAPSLNSALESSTCPSSPSEGATSNFRSLTTADVCVRPPRRRSIDLRTTLMQAMPPAASLELIPRIDNSSRSADSGPTLAPRSLARATKVSRLLPRPSSSTRRYSQSW